MEKDKNFTVGIFNDQDVLISAVTGLREAGVKIYEAYTPFPVHGLGDALGYRRSRLPKAAFVFGATGTTLALTMMFYMMGYDWPMIIGGKNFAALPPFIPVTFEITVLISALGMVGTFMIVADLKPFKKARLMDDRITNDKHAIAVDLADNQMDKSTINNLFTQHGASEVHDKNF